MPERFALYYAPSVTDPLWLRAAQWLGRDAAGTRPAAVEIGGLDMARRLALSASARRYGFHATIKAPMALAAGSERSDLEKALAHFARNARPAAIGRMRVALLDGFVAIVPERQGEALTAAAAAVVAAFDRYRAPLAVTERERRIRENRLSNRQIELLDRFGYPYVMDEFRFHMTLTDRLVEPDRDQILGTARHWFAPDLERCYTFDRIALFEEPAPGAPFVRIGDYPLTSKARMDA
jgi:hypothetical protein